MNSLGRPVLVGTTTIEKSELLAALLSEYQLPYQLLNARPENTENESGIIVQAVVKVQLQLLLIWPVMGPILYLVEIQNHLLF